MRPPVLKADSEAIVDNGTTNISRAIDDRTLNFMEFNFHQFNKSNNQLLQSSVGSIKYLSTSFFYFLSIIHSPFLLLEQ